jgi:hypothetical protein
MDGQESAHLCQDLPSNAQYGFCYHHLMMDHQIQLEQHTQNAFMCQQFSPFFSAEKTYDMTWHFRIL